MLRRVLLYLIFSAAVVTTAFGTDFGNVRGVVHDPQHRPVGDATARIKSATSDWSATTQTDQN